MRSGCCGCSARRLRTWRSYSPSTVCSTSSWRVGSDRRWVSATCWCTTDGPGQPRDFITALARLAGSSHLRKLGDHSLVRAGGRDRRCGGGLHHHASAKAYQHQRQTRGRPQHTRKVCAQTPPRHQSRRPSPQRETRPLFYPHGGAKPPDTLPRKTQPGSRNVTSGDGKGRWCVHHLGEPLDQSGQLQGAGGVLACRCAGPAYR